MRGARTEFSHARGWWWHRGGARSGARRWQRLGRVWEATLSLVRAGGGRGRVRRRGQEAAQAGAGGSAQCTEWEGGGGTKPMRMRGERGGGAPRWVGGRGGSGIRKRGSQTSEEQHNWGSTGWGRAARQDGNSGRDPAATAGFACHVDAASNSTGSQKQAGRREPQRARAAMGAAATSWAYSKEHRRGTSERTREQRAAQSGGEEGSGEARHGAHTWPWTSSHLP